MCEIYSDMRDSWETIDETNILFLLFLWGSHSSLFNSIQSNADTLMERQSIPYRDAPITSDNPYAIGEEEEGPGSAAILQSQYQEMATQDTHLDALSASIGRQHHLSLQMNEELETHAELLEEMDSAVDSTTARLGRASRRLDQVTKSLKEHGEIETLVVSTMLPFDTFLLQHPLGPFLCSSSFWSC